MPTLSPIEQYHDLTRDQQCHESASKRLGDLRSQVLAQMHSGGLSYAQIAELTGLTRARVQQLVERGRTITEENR